MLLVTHESHLDHHIPVALLAHLLDRYKDREGFFLESIEIPAEIAALPCALHGPAVGEPAVPEEIVTYAVRGNRGGPSRLCNVAPGTSRIVTVIAGPAPSGPTVLYTAFGGPQAPREPWEVERLLGEGKATPEQITESKAFWAEHALSR